MMLLDQKRSISVINDLLPAAASAHTRHTLMFLLRPSASIKARVIEYEAAPPKVLNLSRLEFR